MKNAKNTKKNTSLSRARFTELLLAWFKKEARNLPWRQTHDPYRIWISEIMLQQTQVDRVIPKFEAFLGAFPTVQDLARAPQSKVVKHWQGLGYNRRALYVHAAAKKITNELGGVFPKTTEELQTLPGIGPYTAGAIASFAFHAKEPIVDTNVERVIGRIFIGFRNMAKTPKKQYWELMTSLLPSQKNIWSTNQALMDFGAICCTAKNPDCEHCPFQKKCASYPDITSATRQELQYKKQTKEKQYYGKPRRIWRGKILAFLHTQPKGSATIHAIGKAIQQDYSQERSAWLRGVVRVLQKDGFVEYDNKNTVRLVQ